ncbi:glutamate racemase [Nitratidesulfovibrio termitidis]|nr:glutamate racemase [Nitratidesulfovibrio termitidis]
MQVDGPACGTAATGYDYDNAGGSAPGTSCSNTSSAALSAPDAAHLPIGMFDSGVGGLTVLKALRTRMPCEDILYLGDTARLPYGTKSAETITRYAVQAASRLVQRRIKLLVVACNTATSVALDALRAANPGLPVVGVVQPGAQAACRATRRGNIAVIATESTIRGRAYHKAIHSLRPDAQIIGQPCPLFVPLAEEGWVDGKIVEDIAARYLDPIFRPASGSDTPETPDCLVLGCTHFPLLARAIRNVIGPEPVIVDSAATTALAVQAELQAAGLVRPLRTGPGGNECGEARFLTTDDVPRFARTGGLFLGTAIAPDEVELIDL